MQEVDRNYYVYLYLKPDGTTFYVGKGKDDRWKYHLNEARKDNTTEKMKKPKSKFPCPHCGKLVSGGNMKRWHGDNCKLKDKGGQDAIGE